MKSRIMAMTVIALLLSYGGLRAQNAELLPYQNTQLSIDERVNDLVSRMTMKEKVTQLFNAAEPIDRLGVPAYNWWNECLHGVARAGKATVFPQAIGLAATFDQNLMFRVAEVISEEARAKHNYFVENNVRSIYTGLTFWTPNINIFRDPRWGRGQETYGEDPYLTGRMAVSFIKGLQGNDPKYFKTIATAKHYAVHSGPEFTRHIDNIFVNDRDLYDTYLPAFKAAVTEANVQSVMCAYNRFRDKPCCGNDILLSNILRNKYGFSGYVVSDCGAISDFFTPKTHHVVKTPEQAWGWSISTGTDLNCEQSRTFLVDHLDSAIKVGILNESDINTSVHRLFKARFQLGLFDPKDKVSFNQIPYSVVGSAKNLSVSQEAAEKSIVLLKNTGILPFKNVRKVALIGPNANNPAILIGNYNGIPIRPVTPLKAFRDRLGASNVVYTQGCPIVPGVFTDPQIIDAGQLMHKENGAFKKGLKGEYFDNTKMTGTPKLTRVDPKIDFYWDKSPINGKVEDHFSVRWTGYLVPAKSATYQFAGQLSVKVDGKKPAAEGVVLEKGKKYELLVEMKVNPSSYENAIEPSAQLRWVETTRDYHQEALEAAKKSDVIVFCGGISAELEGEEMPLEIDGFSHGDRTHLRLPQVQENLLKELKAIGKPIVYVNFSGSAVALNWEQENLPAIVQGFYPGETTGNALVRILFGDVNPSGRLPITFYHSEKDLPDFHNYDMEGRTYRYFKGKPLYPFGYGLSYTNFEYSNLNAPKIGKTNSEFNVSATIRNSGTVDGEEVVQLYVANKHTQAMVPTLALKGFQRVMLKKGESKEITFTLKPEYFVVTNGNALQVVEPGTYEISVARSSGDEQAIRSTITLEGSTFEVK